MSRPWVPSFPRAGILRKTSFGEHLAEAVQVEKEPGSDEPLSQETHLVSPRSASKSPVCLLSPGIPGPARPSVDVCVGGVGGEMGVVTGSGGRDMSWWRWLATLQSVV